MKLTDTHAHLDFEQYDTDREQVCLRASTELHAVINVGVDPISAQKCLDLSNKYRNFYAAVGWHPNSADEYNPLGWVKIEQLARNARTVAIGETGLDFFHHTPIALQESLFGKHLQLASELKKPIIIHCRQATTELITFLQKWQESAQLPTGVVHCFAEEMSIAQTYLEMGFYIALGGVVTFKQATSLLPMVKALPLNRLLLETDCPFLAPQLLRGKRNEPAYIYQTADFIAKVRGIDYDTLAQQTTQNACRLFNLSA